MNLDSSRGQKALSCCCWAKGKESEDDTGIADALCCSPPWAGAARCLARTASRSDILVRQGGREGTNEVEEENTQEGEGSLARRRWNRRELPREQRNETSPKNRNHFSLSKQKLSETMPPASSLVSLFVPHGAPTMALQKPPGPAAQALRKLGMEMMRKSGSEDDDDKEIGGDTSELASDARRRLGSHHQLFRFRLRLLPLEGLCSGTEHDFHGFPKELYEISYPVRGDEEVAREASRLLERAGLLRVEGKEKETKKEKLDHGAWTPLRLMFPVDGGEMERISVVRVSVQPDLGPAHALAVGKALSSAPPSEASEGEGREGEAARRRPRQRQPDPNPTPNLFRPLPASRRRAWASSSPTPRGGTLMRG